MLALVEMNRYKSFPKGKAVSGSEPKNKTEEGEAG